MTEHEPLTKDGLKQAAAMVFLLDNRNAADCIADLLATIDADRERIEVLEEDDQHHRDAYDTLTDERDTLKERIIKLEGLLK